MARFALADLIKPLTVDEARTSIYAAMTTLGLRTTTWEAGAVTRTIVTACSLMFAALSRLQADLVRSGFLDFAEGTWLKLVALHVYGVEPIEATFATGTVVLTNTGGGLFDVAAGDLVVRNANTKKAYRNLAAFSLGAGTSIAITVVALEAGSESNANVGAIVEFVTTLTRVTVNNPVPLIGIDEESAPALRARCREKLGSLSPMGPWDAYSYAARIAKTSSGATAGVTRTATTRDGYGNLYLRVASGSGGIAGTEGDLNTPLGAIDEAVQRSAAPLGITAHVLSATPVLVPVVYEAWAYNTSGQTSDAMKASVAKALQALSASQSIGGAKLSLGDTIGQVYPDAIRAAISAAQPWIFHVNLLQPAAEVPITAGQVPVLMHDPVTQGTITQVARPEGSVV